MIKKILYGMNHLHCKINISYFCFVDIFLLFSNHIKGQDILHVDVYDEDLIFDDKIGSVKINLQELYAKNS